MISFDDVENGLQSIKRKRVSLQEKLQKLKRPNVSAHLEENDPTNSVNDKNSSQISDDIIKNDLPNDKIINMLGSTGTISSKNDNIDTNIDTILSLQSAKERENKKIAEELSRLLNTPTAKQRSIMEQFRSTQGHVQEYCPRGTPEECIRINRTKNACSKLHFLRIIQRHTDESLGDCSFLNTCFNRASCKYVHYEVEVKNSSQIDDQQGQNDKGDDVKGVKGLKSLATAMEQSFKRVLFPPQWIRCDLRFFDMRLLGKIFVHFCPGKIPLLNLIFVCLGKFAVIMADPPWDIHMELPYGTMQDDEMRNLNVPTLQDEGLIFLWVTGRAMELGRECLKLWGYDRCDELIWVKTNQLQRLIRTGRTGHWLNHGKEHCLVGVKGNPKHLNRGLDCDVIVAEVRATSHKPDEIYGIIERLSPGTRKIELFGRQHNTQPNWVTLGNQLNGVRLVDPQLIQNYRRECPEEAEKYLTNDDEI